MYLNEAEADLKLPIPSACQLHRADLSGTPSAKTIKGKVTHLG